MNDLFFLIPVLLIVIAILLLLRTTHRREVLDIPKGTPIYLDRVEKPGKLLRSEKFGLMGRPDFLLHQDAMIIPIEVKTGATPRTPYPSHIMQLIAYCVLTEANYDIRPTHGIIRYPQQQFEIPFTEEREDELWNILADMRAKKRMAEVHRNHHNEKRCISCGFSEHCSERLDTQLSLPLDK